MLVLVHLLSGRLMLFFFFILVVQFANPSFNAAKMERLVALLAIPYCTFLEDRIVTNDAFLSTFGKCLNEIHALFC